MSDDFSDGAAGDQLVFGGDESADGKRASHKGWWIGGGALALLAIGGGAAAWAAASFFGQGSQPAEALPDSTIGYLSVDLDPSGGQKIAALKLARKFPAFKDEVGLQTGDDIRQWAFDRIADDSGCKVDFDKDVAPWLGSRLAVAAVGDVKTFPVVVLQTTDAAKANAGLKKITACDTAEHYAWKTKGDWTIVAETQAQVDEVVAGAEKGSLAGDPDFKSWTDKAGDSGIMTAYAAPAAGPALAKGLTGVTEDLGTTSGPSLDSGSSDADTSGAQVIGGVPSVDDMCTPDMLSETFTRKDCEKAFKGLSATSSGSSSSSPLDPFGMLNACPGLGSGSNPSAKRLQSQLADFRGAAASLRFSGDGLELETVGDTSAFGSSALGAATGTPVVSTLPSDTAAALGISIPKGWTDKLADNLATMCGDGADPKALFGPLSTMTGLDLPGDLEKLFGDSAALALGPDLDVERLVNGGDPTDLPVALKVRGDKDTIDRVLAKLRQSVGAPDDLLVPVAGDGAVALGPDNDYAADVAKTGTLGQSHDFTAVVPKADKATTVLYVNVNRLEAVIKALASGDKDVTDNLAPLKAFAMSGWTEGKDSHALLRLTVD